jgi:hypothetical protein
MHPIEPEELMAYLDGELPPQRASVAGHHLSHCLDCQLAAAELQDVSRRLLEWQIEELVPRVEQVVNSARPPEKLRPAWRQGVPWIAGLAAACLLLVMFVQPRLRPPANKDIAVPARWKGVIQQEQGGQQGQQGRGDTPLQVFEPVPQAAPLPAQPTAPLDTVITREPLVVRTAQIFLTTPHFATARASLEDILKRHGGHIGALHVGSPADSGQTLQATLRIPARQLDAVMSEIRQLGRVETEQQAGQEVGRQLVDLEARLANSRNAEQRLADILRRSTGKISDVLAVEKEIDRVRGDIERMEAERKNLGDQVLFATLDVRINEEYKAHINVSAPSTLGRLRNSAVEGYRNLADTLTGLAMFILSYGPALVVWAALVFFPARYAWRWFRKSRKPLEGSR